MDQITYRLPLVIGATGHRDLRDKDIPALRSAVREVIECLRRDYIRDGRWFCRVPVLRTLCRWLRLCPQAETPIIVLSSLAEGADRLIAREAMDDFAIARWSPTSTAATSIPSGSAQARCRRGIRSSEEPRGRCPGHAFSGELTSSGLIVSHCRDRAVPLRARRPQPRYKVAAETSRLRPGSGGNSSHGMRSRRKQR